MNTKDYQRTLLSLLKGHKLSANVQDPYFTALEDSKQLEVARDIAVWWRCVQLERYTLLTAAYLKRHQLFDAWVKEYFQNKNVSPYYELAGLGFLEFVQQRAHPVLAALAAFEEKLIRIRRGDQNEYQLHWPVEPYKLLDSLLYQHALPDETITGMYTMKLHHSYPSYFIVYDENMQTTTPLN